MSTTQTTKARRRHFPFGFTADDESALASWLRSRCERSEVRSAKVRDLDKLGGLSGDFFLLDCVLEDGSSVSLAVKTTGAGEGKQEAAKMLGTPREGLFFAQLAGELPTGMCPASWFAHGDMESGEKLVVMECLQGAVPCGLVFGRGQPNNRGIDEARLRELTGGCPSMREMTSKAFELYARMHARYWRDPSLKDKPWLRGVAWARGEGRESWEAAQKMASAAWIKQRNLREHGQQKIEWDPHVVKCLDKSFSLVSWERFQNLLQKGCLSSAWSLVHGDCHPHNALWRKDTQEMVLIDFEMVGLGSPPQELGQYMISHMPPNERRTCERDLVASYHKELCRCLRERGKDKEADAFTLEQCWREYLQGGSGRWIWFVPYLVEMLPSEMGQWFHDQLGAFLHDHFPNVEDITMPRV